MSVNPDLERDNETIRKMREDFNDLKKALKAKDDEIAAIKAEADGHKAKLTDIERAKLEETDRLKLQVTDLITERDGFKAQAAQVEPLGKTLQGVFEARVNSIPEERRAAVMEAIPAEIGWDAKMKLLDTMASFIPQTGAPTVKTGVFGSNTEVKATETPASPRTMEELIKAPIQWKGLETGAVQ